MTNEAPGRAVGNLRGSGPAALVAVLVVAYLVAFQWAVSRVYVLNFSTAGPNVSAALLVLYVTGWSVGVAGLFSLGRRTLFVGGSALVGALTVLAPLPAALVAGLLSLAAMSVATPMLVALLADARESFAVGAAVGVLGYHVVRVWLNTAPMYATAAGWLFAVALAGALFGVALWLARTGALPPVEWSAPSVSAAPAFAFLFLQGLFLANPQVIAWWWIRPYAPAALAALVGLVAAVAWLVADDLPSWLAVERVLSGRRLWLVAAVFLFSTLGLLYWPSSLAVLALAPAQATAVLLLAAGCRQRSPRRVRSLVGELVVVQFVGVAFAFLYVSAMNWPYVPDPLPSLTRGRPGLFVLAVHALLPAAVVLTVRGRDAVAGGRDSAASAIDPTGDRATQTVDPTGNRATQTVDPGRSQSTQVADPGRRWVLASAGLGAAGGLGLFAPDLRDGMDPPAAPPYRVLSFNLHQYLGGDRAGRYNLVAVADLIRSSDAHVVGLQETQGGRFTSGNVDGLRWLADELDYHCVYGVPTSTATYGVALLSRWPVLSYDVVRLPVQESTPRLALVARLDAPDGPLPVVVTHFQTRKPAARQTAEARRVVELVTEERDFDRALVVGDFNVLPGENDGPLQILRAAFVDAWAAADERSGPGATYIDPPQRIDYVFLHGDWRVRSATTLGELSVSDHRGVLAVVDPG